jgi:hypothetical protein
MPWSRRAPLSTSPLYTYGQDAGARFPTVDTQRATSRGSRPAHPRPYPGGPRSLAAHAISPCRRHGPRVSLPDGKPEAPVNQSFTARERASRYHGGRRWTAVTSPCAPRPIAPTRCGRRRATSSPTRPFPTQHHCRFPGSDPTALLDRHHAAVSAQAEEDLGDTGPHQRYESRAGHLVPYTASLATHATSDAGPGRSRVSMGCSPRQSSSASSQVCGVLTTSTISST